MVAIRRMFLSAVFLLAAIPMVRLMAWKDPGWSEVVMQQVLPVQAKPGDEAVIIGHFLDAAHVFEVHLIDGKNDYRVEILQQCDTAIRFKVPSRIAPGQMQIAARVARYSMLLDQPVFLKILEPVG